MSAGAARRQPSIPKRSQCSATVIRDSRAGGGSTRGVCSGGGVPPPPEAARRRGPDGELRQGWDVPPRLEAGAIVVTPRLARRVGGDPAPARQDVLIQVEPIAVRRGGACLEDVLEREEPAPGVVEDAVEDDA